MANLLLVEFLTWLHLFSVIGWFGAALLFFVVIEPSLPKLSPQTNGELILKMFPRFVRYVEIFATMTLIFGLALALAISNGNLSLFTSGWGLDILAGAFLGLATLLIVFLLLAPSVKELGRLVIQMQQSPQQTPPARFHTIQERLKYGAPVAIILLSVAMVFMVASAGG